MTTTLRFPSVRVSVIINRNSWSETQTHIHLDHTGVADPQPGHLGHNIGHYDIHLDNPVAGHRNIHLPAGMDY